MNWCYLEEFCAYMVSQTTLTMILLDNYLWLFSTHSLHALPSDLRYRKEEPENRYCLKIKNEIHCVTKYKLDDEEH